MIYFLRQHNLFFRQIGWLTLLSLLLPMMASLALKSASGDANRPMAHCAMMMAEAPTQDSTQPSDHKSPDKLPSCPICQNLNILSHGFVVPTVMAAMILLMTKGIALTQTGLSFVPAQSVLIAWPRAPPRL
jgi:hypothetical protein